MLPLLRVVMLLRCSVAASPTTPHCCDNLARRLLKTTSLDVKRYGPPGKINDADVRRISSQDMAIAADSEPWNNSKRARKRRRQWESQAFAKNCCILIIRETVVCLSSSRLRCDIDIVVIIIIIVRIAIWAQAILVPPTLRTAATGPAIRRPQAQQSTATGSESDGHRPSNGGALR